ncbi:predicted protein [Naegleria gruberi]|uniref:tRNA-dihydrouridine(16/17) synthase [NAD(P)(+)] n=1 Tax=Naegleria gruberi TaxID=5762 RepID=D2VPF2_NAEGR|nr:uncharacterized protein NAEGRDRAFT_51216 [Naegleria gruberi]EFC41350.1 predicted protein [Naegleria gruberi]|eukprot:XP_002674094.1 predicted protein [Naegleria gruberi strain NEG-M]
MIQRESEQDFAISSSLTTTTTGKRLLLNHTTDASTLINSDDSEGVCCDVSESFMENEEEFSCMKEEEDEEFAWDKQVDEEIEVEKEEKGKLGYYDFWRSIGSPKYVVAPMVDQSEMAFRLLSKEYGATLAYTPMFHGMYFAYHKKYRARFYQFNPDLEGPVFAQFCTNDPETFVQCGKRVWDLSKQKISAIDLNLGCPQRIARRGRYGSFLMEDLQTVHSIINKAHLELPMPVTAKIRIFEDLELTMNYVKTVVDAGAQVLCVHGRTREQKGANQNYADWTVIRAIREQFPQIPMIANGNIRTFQDVQDCLEYTRVDAVMSGEGLLENPALFNGGQFVHPLDISDKYVNICKTHFPPDHNNIKRHLFRILDKYIPEDRSDLRGILGKASLWEHYREFVDYARKIENEFDFKELEFEPSICVVTDPENHPIVKKPLRKKDVETDSGAADEE